MDHGSEVRRARLLAEMEQEFVPDYRPENTPPTDKRGAYALEQIAFRMSRIDKKLDSFIAAVELLASKR